MRIIIQVRELVSSNVTAMVEKASDPAKMLRLLRKEIEEADIALHGEISTMTRQKSRAEASAKRLGEEVAGWSEKAKVAMDHNREDLARSALLAREDVKLQASNHEADALGLADEIDGAEAALKQLEAKLAETNAQLKEQDTRDASRRASPAAGSGDNNADRRLDRIANLERRVDHSLNNQGETAKSAAAIEAEIAAMSRNASVDAELEKLKSGAVAKKKRKAG